MSLHSDIIQLRLLTREFEANIKRLQNESKEVMGKTLRAGLSALASSAARHTPPSIKSSTISPKYYEDGVFYRSSSGRAHGRRRIYDLMQLARDPATGHYRRHYGKLLRQGYYYVVSIYRPGRKVKQVPCRTYEEALKYAHVTYRGLMRAAWGMNIRGATGTAPAAFRKLLSLRPQLSRMSHLNVVDIKDGEVNSMEITNRAVPSAASFITDLEAGATRVSVRTMNDYMNKFFKRKKEL